MSQDLIVQIFREFLKTAIILMGPILFATVIVGLLVSIFQAATQFMTSYTVNLFSNIPAYVK